MGWSLGYDENWERDIGYGVPAFCDHAGCTEEIDRGLAYVCGEDPYGGERGCGLYFCGSHLYWHERLPHLCEKCSPPRLKLFKPTPEHPIWVKHKLTDPSWEEWRKVNPKEVEALRIQYAECLKEGRLSDDK